MRPRTITASVISFLLKLSSIDGQNISGQTGALPWDESDALDSEIGEAFRTEVEGRENQRPLFDPGSYTTTVSFSSSKAEAEVDVIGLGDAVGLPADIGNVMIMRPRLLKVIGLGSEKDEADLLLATRVLGGSSDRLIDNIFNRVRIARLPEPIISNIIEVLWKAIDFGFGQVFATAPLEKKEFWDRRLQVMIEVLSRFAVRLPNGKAIETVRRGASIAKAR